MSNSPDFRWTDYLTLASALAKVGKCGEAAQRSVISRAYYAAFHVAMGLLTRNGFQPRRTGDDHHRVWRAYREGKGTGRERKQIARMGFGLLYDRVESDYRMPFQRGRVEDKVQEALMTARHIVDWVGREQARQGGGSPGASPA